MKLLAVDAPSVDPRESKSLPVHKMIFSGNGCIVENLDLRRINAGEYKLIAFPQKLMALDAAPLRAVLADLERL
jgi:arylformamidase